MELNTSDINSVQNETTNEPPNKLTWYHFGFKTVQRIKRTPIGPARTLNDLSVCEWLYVTIAMITVAYEACISVAKFIIVTKSSEEFTYALLILWTSVFSLIYVIQGFIRERVLELFAFVVTICLLVVYVGINYWATDSPNCYKLVSLAIIFAFGPILILTSPVYIKKYDDSKHLLYRTMGAKVEMQSMCDTMFIANTFIIFDVQLSGSSLILWLRNGIEYWTTTEIIVVSAGTLITLLWTLLGLLSMRFENKPMVYTFLALSIFNPIFVMWNFYRYIKGADDELLQTSVFVSGIISLIIRLITIWGVLLVFKNFNKGLKQRVYGSGDQNAFAEALPLINS